MPVTDTTHAAVTIAADPRRPPQAAGGTPFKPFGADGFTFGDLVDMLNPLHHIPIIGTIYRKITGDEIAPPARIAGGTLFAGPIGAAMAVVSMVVERTSGIAPAEQALADSDQIRDRARQDEPNGQSRPLSSAGTVVPARPAITAKTAIGAPPGKSATALPPVNGARRPQSSAPSMPSRIRAPSPSTPANESSPTLPDDRLSSAAEIRHALDASQQQISAQRIISAFMAGTSGGTAGKPQSVSAALRVDAIYAGVDAYLRHSRSSDETERHPGTYA